MTFREQPQRATLVTIIKTLTQIIDAQYKKVYRQRLTTTTTTNCGFKSGISDRLRGASGSGRKEGSGQREV